MDFGASAWGAPRTGTPSLAYSYDGAAGQKKSISLQGAPAFRGDAAIVWTGSRMLVWGGRAFSPNSDGSYNDITYDDGGLYDPVADAWTPMSGTSAPPTQTVGSFVWSGTQLLLWGGMLAAGISKEPLPGTMWPSVQCNAAPSGAIYDVATDAWTSMPADGQPSPRGGQATVWTGTEMIVWGGSDGGISNHGYRYNPSTDAWQYITTVGAPSPRVGAGATWTGHSLVVWGGTVGEARDYIDGAQWFPNAADVSLCNPSTTCMDAGLDAQDHEGASDAGAVLTDSPSESALEAGLDAEADVSTVPSQTVADAASDAGNDG